MMAVYRVTARIPRGSTRTYAQIARAVGRPTAARAVGTALHRNPYPKHLVPCHRVIRSDGTLGGYAHGLDKKKALLRKERACG